MNSAELQQAAERLSGQPWRVSHDRHGAVGTLAHALGVNTTDILRWHRRNEVPEDAAKTIILLMEDGVSEEQLQADEAGNGLTPIARRLLSIDIRSSSTNDLAIRLWELDMAMTHLTRNQGVLGLGANAVQQSMRDEKNAIVEQLSKLGRQFQEQPS